MEPFKLLFVALKNWSSPPAHSGAQSHWDHTGELMLSVTTPSEIIPYYHINHFIWSLSDNKESSR
jgi:hypothetical protein